MNINDLLKSKGYLEASEKVKQWRARLEKGAFFAGMKAAQPELYAAFQVDDQALSRRILAKLTGKDARID